MRHVIASAIALTALSSTAAHAGNADADTCTALSPQAEAVQFGSRSGSRYLLIRDGDAHFRIDLFRTVDIAPMASPLRLVSGGHAGSVCTHGKTVVKAANGRVYWASQARAIDAERYAKLTRNLAKVDQKEWQASLRIDD